MNDKNLNEAKVESIAVSPAAYSSTPWWYDLRGFFILTFAYRDTLWSQMDFFNKNIGKVHLEGAIGTGTLSSYILIYRKIFYKANDFIFYGVDYAPEMLNGAKAKLKGKNIVIEHGDLTQLKFLNNFFDTINLANSFHTIKDIENALKDLNRVLKPEGTIAMNILIYPQSNGFLDIISNKINKWGQDKGILYRPYEPNEVLIILKKLNFEVIFQKKKGNAFYLICKRLL